MVFCPYDTLDKHSDEAFPDKTLVCSPLSAVFLPRCLSDRGVTDAVSWISVACTGGEGLQGALRRRVRKVLHGLMHHEWNFPGRRGMSGLGVQ